MRRAPRPRSTWQWRATRRVCRIVLFGEEPIGYAHAVDVGLWGGARPQEIEPGTWDVDLFIGSEQHRSRGLGGVALGRLVEEVFATTLAVACCGLVSIRNEAAVRAYERAGFAGGGSGTTRCSARAG